MNREAIYQALFTRLSSVSDFVIAERRVTDPENVKSYQMPAFFMVQTNEKSDYENQVHGTPVKRMITVWCRVYVASPPAVDDGNGNLSYVWPSSVINPIMDKIEAVAKPNTPVDRTQTLGGLVHWVYIGEIKFFQHEIASQMMAEFPVHMLVTV